jgi:hypothetical protein
VTLSVHELRAIAAKHLRKARTCTGDAREFELYLARAYKFLADDEERCSAQSIPAVSPGAGTG